MAHKRDLMGHLLVALALISFLALTLNVWGLYFFMKFVSNPSSDFNTIFMLIWLPALPILIVWLLVIIFAAMRWRFITIILLAASYWIVKNSVNNIIHISGVTGLEYWVSYLASWTALIAVLLNIIIALTWGLKLLMKYRD